MIVCVFAKFSRSKIMAAEHMVIETIGMIIF
jgi:hypothetical protein